MKKAKKAKSLLMATAVAVGVAGAMFTAGVSAESNEPSVTQIEGSISSDSNVVFDDVLDANGSRLRETTPPTVFHDLSSQAYNASLSYVNVGWLYTNKYFHAKSDGKIYVDYSFTTMTGRPVKLRVGIYNLATKKVATYVDTAASNTVSTPKTGTVIFSNITPSDNVAIAFTAINDGTQDGLTGTAKVYYK